MLDDFFLHLNATKIDKFWRSQSQGFPVGTIRYAALFLSFFTRFFRFFETQPW